MSAGDSPEREFDIYDSEGLPAATLEHEESTSNRSNIRNQAENPVVKCGGLIWVRLITA